MKTDTIFYRIFQSLPSIFFELINQPPKTAHIYQFSSVEVKQTSFRIDGVFLPKAANQPIYFVEVQFQTDVNFYSRFFTEIFNYLDKTEFENDWRGVVIYPNPNIETKKTERYEEFLNSGRVTRIYLNQISATQSLGLATVKLIIESESQAIEQAKSLINQAKENLTDATIKQNFIELIETIIVYKFPQLRREEIEKMFELGELRQTRYFQDVFEEGKLEGQQEGKLQGQQEGNLAGKLESIPALLALGLTVEQIANALKLSLEQVQQVAQQESEKE